MPTYEYACRSCGEHLEVVQSFKDDALTTCPSCQGELRKVFSAAGIIFKGSGWHVKDYASKSTSTTAAAGDTSSSEGSGSSDAGSSGDSTSSSTSSSKGSDTSSSSSSSEKSA
jgi:putative FmdB family regulatory protein